MSGTQYQTVIQNRHGLWLCITNFACEPRLVWWVAGQTHENVNMRNAHFD